MFEFNREFIINDNDKGPLASGKRFEYDDVAKVLKVGKMVNIEAAKVKSIHRAPYLPEISEKVELPLTVTDSNVIKGTLVVTIAQEGRIISLVSDRLADHTKDYIFNGTPADWVNQFNRQAAMEDMDRLIDIEVVAGTPDKLVIKAKDCYTRIVKVVYDAAAGTGIEPSRTWNRVTHFQSLIPSTWVGGVLAAGTEGMGTVTRILKNMRLQTNAHLHPHGFDKDERPLMHGEYEQWTIQYVSERRHQSGEVFGSINHSLVTLIFFVEAGVVADWEKVIFAGTDATGKEAAPAASTLAKDANEAVCVVLTATGTPARLVDKAADAAANAGDKDGVYEKDEEIAIDSKKHKLSK